MTANFRWFAPQPEPIPEILRLALMTREFHREVADRKAFQQHCQWYRETAQRHQEELAKMRRDPHLFRFFYRQ